jgi:riboflavin kinase/FMN adenylyltransferase
VKEVPIAFRAHVVSGSGRGKRLGVPTINLNLRDVPRELGEGIYACLVHLDEATKPLRAALHYGPRPVFKDTVACEVHLIDTALHSDPESLTVEVIGRIRDVANFPSPSALKEQILRDIEDARAMLKQHDREAA